MAADLSLELPQHAQAMRSLARLLVGSQDADDLLQDVTLQVLAAPPPPGAWWPGWLRVVLQRRAGNMRRGDRRRAQRERAVATAVRDDASDPANAAAHRETLARVTKALLELPDPYRDVLFQRFFQDLTPTAIAAATGQPLATVKSRLQRGLDLLRERIEARIGDDWRFVVSAAFGLDRALLTDVAAMTTAGALLLGGLQLLAAAGLAVGVWFAVDAALPSAPGATTSVAAQSASAATADATRQVERDRESRTVVATPDGTVNATGLAVLRGRCVDATGQPLAGVEVEFRASASAGSRLDDWTRWQDPPQPVERRARTGADGMFAFACAPLPPLGFELHLRAAGLVERAGSWFDLEPGQVIDTGDLTMIGGVRCIGRVVDRHGKPQDDVVVELEHNGSSADDVAMPDGGWSLTRSDGTFAFEQLLSPGDYAVHIDERRSLTPGRVLVDGRSPVQSFEIVTDAAITGMHLAGIVVDDHGEPVPQAAMRGDGRVSGSTGTDGRFRIARPEGAVDAVAVTVDAADFEPWRSREPLAWGRNDVRIELQRGAPLDVDAATADGAPVRAFQLRLRRLDDSGSAESVGRVLGAGEHDGGRLQVASLRRGRWLMRVEPRDRALDASPFEVVEVAGNESVHVAVTVPRRGERTVRLQFGDGTPVVGSTVELLDLCGRRDGRRPDEYERWSTGIDSEPVPPTEILQTAQSGADGSVALVGPAGVPLTLRIRGAGHVATIHDGVVLGEPDPLVVTVARGGRVIGKVTPRGVLAQFRRMALLEPEGPWQDNAPRIVLYRREGGTAVGVSGSDEGRIDTDGAFAVGGLRAGTWDFGLEHASTEDGRSFSTGWEPLGSIAVRDDAVTERDVDLRPIAPGELSGLVLCNGEPFANVEGNLERKEGVRPDGSAIESGWGVTTDAEGRFTALLLPGEYYLELWPHGEMFVPRQRVFVGAGSRSEATFTVAAGNLHLRVLTAAGEPVRGVVPGFVDPTAGWSYGYNIGSNETGRLVVRLQEGEYEVRVPPRALGTAALRRAWSKAHGVEAPQLLVAKIAVRGGEEVVRELRLPPEWEQEVR